MNDPIVIIIVSLALFGSGLFAGLVLRKHDLPVGDVRKTTCPHCGFVAAWIPSKRAYTCMRLECARWFDEKAYTAASRASAQPAGANVSQQ